MSGCLDIKHTIPFLDLKETLKFLDTFLDKSVYHMTLLLFSGLRHVIDNVMETHCITLWVGISNVMTTYVTTMQIFIE